MTKFPNNRQVTTNFHESAFSLHSALFYVIELPLRKTEIKSDPVDDESNEAVDQEMCLADTSMPADDPELDEQNSTTAEEVHLRARSGIHGFDSLSGVDLLFFDLFLIRITID